MARSEHQYPPATQAAIRRANAAYILAMLLADKQSVPAALTALRELSEWEADYDLVSAVEPVLEKARAEAGRPPVAIGVRTYTTAHIAGIFASVALEDLVREALGSPAALKEDFRRWLESQNGAQSFDSYDFAADRADKVAAAAQTWKLTELQGLCAEIQLESHYLPQKKTNGADGDPRCKHSSDFRSVVWHGESYAFTATQAPAVEKLWQAWKNGTPELSQATILDEIGAESRRLSDLFKGHQAWNIMIVPGSSRGAFRLSEPPK